MPIWSNEASEAREQERRDQRDALAKLAKAAAKLADQLNKRLAEAGDVLHGKLPSSPCPTTVLHRSADQPLEDVKLAIEEIMASAARSGNKPLTALFFDCDDYEQANPPGFPATFRRVTVPGSQASLDSETGDLVAANQKPTIHSEEALKAAVQNHLNPSSQKPSCFISVFSD
ncbi:hypothetical protein C7999DRAFT_34624 [Corynascus novoguineensis]|uniref:Uncharacterized protein n=1 Tax=Corynascus novoguineensis TaxID=1126955 RepID=A0AAN7HGW9_9PEZI|nr:hypothetical protein C7999DRAFT_34624 [Corynascus novoguineensis]